MTTAAGEIATSSSENAWWMKAFAGICVLTLLVSIGRDLFYAPTREVEVWFGLEVTGMAAYLSAPLHWTIFAVGAWGFWRHRSWALPAGAAYLYYAALCHLVWSEASINGRGWPIGLLQAAALCALALALLRLQRYGRERL